MAHEVFRRQGACEGRARQDSGRSRRSRRPVYGKEANRVKTVLTEAYEKALAEAKEQSLQASLTKQPARRDAAGPAAAAAAGCTSPTQMLRQIYAIFADLGFQVYRSREVEDDETNFELLNMPPHHPARDMWDTFHTTTPGVLLRTHTSPGQIHVMRELCPQADPRDPARACATATRRSRTRSEIQFHQVEGLVVGERRDDGRPEGHDHRVRPPAVRPGAAGAHPVELLPVHRAVDRGGHRLAEGRPERATG